MEKYSLHKKPLYFRHKVGYEGDTDEDNICTDDSLTETDDFVRNLDKEHKNDDD